MDLEREYLLQNYARYPLVLHRGEGPRVWDVNGKQYLDFISGIGVNALGHDHPRITRVIRGTGAPVDPLVQSLLPRVPGTAGAAHRQDQRPAAFVLLQQRNRSHGRRAQDGPRPRTQAQRGQVRDHFARQFLSRPHHGRALDHRAAEVPQGFRAADPGRSLRHRRTISANSKRPSASVPPASSSSGFRAKAASSRSASSTPRAPANWPTATTPCWCSTRSSAASDAPARTSAISLPTRSSAGRDGGGQAAGLRSAARRHHRQ